MTRIFNKENLMKRIIVFLFLMGMVHVCAQGTIFGLADYNLGIIRPNYSAPGLARSYEVANIDSLHLNYQNFSAWSAINYTSYTIDAAFMMGFSKDRYGENYYRDFGSFQGGFLAVPIIPQKLVIGAGIQPVISQEHSIKDTSISASTGYSVFKCGLNRITGNVSYKLTNSLGVGIGYEYTFGKLEDYYRLELAGDNYSPLTFKYDYRFGGHGMVFSAHYILLDLMTIGVLYRPPVNLSMDIIGITDAIALNTKSQKTLTLPAQLNFGLKVDLSQRFKTGFDVIYQNWEDGYKIEDKKEIPYQSDYFRFGIGMEYTESPRRFTKLQDAMNYRLGLFFGKQKITSLGNSVPEYGISMGFSLPLFRFVSRIDFTGIAGRRGSVSNNYYEENFIQFGISISTSERWFLKIED
jgi:hypothetical protein